MGNLKRKCQFPAEHTWLRIKGKKGQVFKAWSTSRKSQSQIQHLGRAFEHNLAPRDGNLNKLILNSSNAWGRGDVEASNCLTHKCGIIGNTLVLSALIKYQNHADNLLLFTVYEGEAFLSYKC